MAALGAAPHAQLRLLNKLNFLNYFYVIEKKCPHPLLETFDLFVLLILHFKARGSDTNSGVISEAELSVVLILHF